MIHVGCKIGSKRIIGTALYETWNEFHEEPHQVREDFVVMRQSSQLHSVSVPGRAIFARSCFLAYKLSMGNHLKAQDF